jgi:hypothetical protein
MQEALVALSDGSAGPNAADVRARVLARARDVDPSSHRARVRFCKTLRATDGEFVPGETSAALAELWGLATSTVQRDMSIAYAESVEEAQDVDRAIWWHGMYELLEAARGDGALVQECVDSMRDASGRLMVNEMGLKMISDAMGRARDSVLKVQEQLGKALGVIQSGSKVDIRVDVIDPGERKPRKADPVVVANAWSRAQAFFVEAHPELLAEFLAYCGAIDTVGEEV